MPRICLIYYALHYVFINHCQVKYVILGMLLSFCLNNKLVYKYSEQFYLNIIGIQILPCCVLKFTVIFNEPNLHKKNKTKMSLWVILKLFRRCSNALKSIDEQTNAVLHSMIYLFHCYIQTANKRRGNYYEQ